MSKRSEIVEKVVERLGTIVWNTPPAYFKNPFREIHADELPAIRVALISGTSERINNDIEYRHKDQLAVTYLDHGNEDDNIATELYDSIEHISTFLIRDENDSADENALHHVVSDLELTEWALDQVNAEIGISAIVAMFDVIYHSRIIMELPDLTQVNIDTLLVEKEVVYSDKINMSNQ